MFFLGIDVGKVAHEAALLDEAEQVVWRLRFASTKAGLQALAGRLAGLSAQEVVVGFEATSMFCELSRRSPPTDGRFVARPL